MSGPRVLAGTARTLLAALGCGVLFWVSLGVTFEMMPPADMPSSARSWWPWGAELRTAEAGRRVTLDATPARLDEATALASAAVARSPGSVDAVRTLGEIDILRGDQPRAERAYALAERLSRRDLPTQIFWIQRDVARGDVDGALIHYDRALRTNQVAWPLLLDKLATASAEPAIAAGVARLLDRAPPWRTSYAQLLTEKTVPPPLFATLIARAHLDPADGKQRDALVGALQKLTEERQPRLAYGLLPAASRSTSVPFDGDFEDAADRGIEPFAWHLLGDGDLSATRVASSAGHGETVLRLQATAERGGEVASQTLVLAPGHYSITAMVGEVPKGQGRASIASITCLETTDARLTLPLVGSGNTHRVTGAFTVPAGCAGQRLALSTPPAVSTDGWVDDIVIRPDPA